jgi:hypothetical protein
MLELLRGRDLTVLLLVSLAIYHCLYHHARMQYTIEPVWFVQHSEIPSLSNHLSDHSKTTPRNTIILPPVLSDLDDDGFNELVIVDQQQTIKVHH